MMKRKRRRSVQSQGDTVGPATERSWSPPANVNKYSALAIPSTTRRQQRSSKRPDGRQALNQPEAKHINAKTNEKDKVKTHQRFALRIAKPLPAHCANNAIGLFRGLPAHPHLRNRKVAEVQRTVTRHVTRTWKQPRCSHPSRHSLPE